MPIHIPRTDVRKRDSTLSFISLAALFVNVTAKIEYGLSLRTLIIYTILCVNTRVFPEPAPARIRRGESKYETAKS